MNLRFICALFVRYIAAISLFMVPTYEWQLSASIELTLN